MKVARYYLLAAILILLVAAFLRLYELKDYPSGIYYDEGRILQRAWRVGEGYGLALYFQDIAEPFDAILRGIYHKLTGGVALFMSEIYTLWLNLLAVAATMFAARRLYRKHPQVALISLVAGLALATMPSAVMIGRHLYRANWLPFAGMMGLGFLVSHWQHPKLGYALLAGFFIGIATMMYTGGLFTPPAFFLVTLLVLLQSRLQYPKPKAIVAMSLAFLVTLSPWIFLYLRIPNWLMRVTDLSIQNSPLSNPSLFPEFLRITLNTIFFSDTLHDMRYAPYTTGFQNPVFLVLFGVGAIVSLWQWRKKWRLSPLILWLVMLLPDALSSEPYQPIRLIGTFAPMGLLMAYGLGEVYHWAQKSRMSKKFAEIALAALLIASPIYTQYHVWYHYHEQALITNPYVPHSLAWTYRIGFIDLLENIAQSEVPSYLPLEYLNTDLAVAVLRPKYFPIVRAYAGEALPHGRVILPINSLSFGFFLLEHQPIQYALLLPETGEIVILPPLDLEEARRFEEDIRANGQDIRNEEDWVLGQALDLGAESPFQMLQAWQGDEVLAVYDGNLELVGIDAPQAMQAGELVPVTLFWRLREDTAKDYFSRLQVWDYQNDSQGYELRAAIINEPDFPLNIHYNIYPTVMWQAGEIVADVRWLPVFETAPNGAYRFALAVFDYPGPSPVAFETRFGLAEAQDIWVLLGRSAIGRDAYLAEGENPVFDVRLGNQYQLLDYSINPALAEVQAGDTLRIELIWRALATTSRSYTQFLHVVDESGEIVVQQDSPALNGIFPTWAWGMGDVVRNQFELRIPEDVSLPIHLNTGMYDYPSFDRLAVFRDGVESGDGILRLDALLAAP